MDEKKLNPFEILKQYSSYGHNSGERYQAHVLGTTCDKNNYNAILFVCLQIDVNRNYAEIIIEGDAQYFNYSFKSSYSTDNSAFKLINRTLIIKGTDKFGNNITLEITEK
ncbi:hypothetical protein [Ruminococcus flavefaciens]|uniref:Uncharacterized protein n=1 Tax=Ruminococcus flavefaciens 007c TaxID=1341157 RepID=W7V0D9_RUMFL|nr:hypothetical protein [Ruminococcus flavefaciens]EWM54197.1 hypothetical protein RF007C_02680 [Ruminococcus flavefaciens 007c]